MNSEKVFERVPGLREGIDRRIREAGDKDRAYAACKRLLEASVGWRSPDRDLRTPEAYEAVVRYICGRLNY